MPCKRLQRIFPWQNMAETGDMTPLLTYFPALYLTLLLPFSRCCKYDLCKRTWSLDFYLRLAASQPPAKQTSRSG